MTWLDFCLTLALLCSDLGLLRLRKDLLRRILLVTNCGGNESKVRWLIHVWAKWSRKMGDLPLDSRECQPCYDSMDISRTSESVTILQDGIQLVSTNVSERIKQIQKGHSHKPYGLDTHNKRRLVSFTNLPSLC